MTTLNVSATSDDWRAARCSNFSPDAFTLDGMTFASAEGFIQGIMRPEDDPDRAAAFASVGFAAKRFGRKAARTAVWWKGETIPFGSPEHHRLIGRAIKAKFDQNPGAMAALLATKGLTLIHDLGRPESPRTSLPANVFCAILTAIRDGE
ncbi:MAG TPA: hypothetical protein VLC10_00315 [Patescibacteria group bacterium]|nr:hypothetical protein [Patescibacteria group bacterium]